MNNLYNFRVLNGFEDEDVEEDNVYLTMEDIDLVVAIKSAQSKNLELGKQVELISLGDSHWKEF